MPAAAGGPPRLVLGGNVAAAVAHAVATPEQPALVFPTAGPWRWASWAWLAERVAARAGELAGHAGGSAVAYDWLPTPGGLVTDLAIQAAGCLAWPRSAGEAEGRAAGAAAAGAPDARTGGAGGLPVPARRHEPAGAAAATLARWDDAPATVRWGVLPPRPPRDAGALLARRAEGRAGGAVVAAPAGAVWSPGDLDAAAAVLAPQVATAARPLVLVGPDLTGPPSRAWLSWALACGALLVLPGDRSLVPWALAWARPSHALFAADELAELRAALAELDTPKGLRRRLRRLRHLVTVGEAPADERAAWEPLGVAPVPLARR